VTPAQGTVVVRRALDDGDLATARSLEHDVFVAEGFIARSAGRVVEEYEHLDGQSRWYLAERDGEAAGVLRMIASAPSLVPAVHSFSVEPAMRSELEQQRYAEVGTLALAERHRGTDTGLHLYRAAYRDSVREGVTAWVGVLERWLLEHLVSFGFPFAAMGPSRYYMGGDCLPVVMLFRDVDPTLGRADPALHAWMTSGLPVPASA
jgi:hypothetical protein